MDSNYVYILKPYRSGMLSVWKCGLELKPSQTLCFEELCVANGFSTISTPLSSLKLKIGCPFYVLNVLTWEKQGKKEDNVEKEQIRMRHRESKNDDPSNIWTFETCCIHVWPY